MSRGDEWDDEDWDRPRRSRRDWEDDYYEGLPPYRGEPSGGVTSVAVACFVWSGLFMIFSFCLGFCFLVTMQGRGGGPPPGAVGILGGGQDSVQAIRIIGFFFWAVGAMIGGIGLVMRRAWGRVLTLVLAAFAALGGLGTTVEGLYTFFQSPNNPGLDEGFMVIAFFTSMVVGIMLIIFAIWAFLVLLNSSAHEEFK